MLVVNRDADEYLGCKIKKTSDGNGLKRFFLIR